MSQDPPSLKANWPDVMEKVLQLWSQCVKHRSLPAWMEFSGAGLLLILPSDSVMKQQWSHQQILGNLSAITSNVTLTSKNCDLRNHTRQRAGNGPLNENCNHAEIADAPFAV